MAGLYAPLPTLRRRPRGRPRTAWGRCGSLLLHRSGLSPHTPCRSPGALTRVALSLCTCCRQYPGAAAGRTPSLRPSVSAFPGSRVGLHIVVFEDCTAFTLRCGLHTRTVTDIRDRLSEGFRHFVASMPAPVASGWSDFAGWASHPLESAAFSVAANRVAKIKVGLAALIPFGLGVNSPVAFDRDLARLRLEINRLIAAVGFVDEAIVAVAKARGFTLRLRTGARQRVPGCRWPAACSPATGSSARRRSTT